MTSQAPHADLAQDPGTSAQHTESTVGDRLNWLRAAVLGANDGIVSVAALLIGVAGAQASASALLTAGVAGISSGALSMGVGEYVSVSAQRDSEQALVQQERTELEELPQQEAGEMARMLQELGVHPDTARQAATEIHDDDPLAAHTQLELGIDPEATARPVEAALASTAAFTAGGLVPLLAVLLAPPQHGGPGGGGVGAAGTRAHRDHLGEVGPCTHRPGSGAQCGRWPAGDGDHLRHRAPLRRHGGLTRPCQHPGNRRSPDGFPSGDQFCGPNWT